MKEYKGYLIDLDGTMYRGEVEIEGAASFVHYLKKQHLPYLFLTNNSSKTANQIAEKLVGLGIPADEKQVFTSSMATTSYISDRNEKARVFAIGEYGLIDALEEEGHTLVEEDADYVVMGIDRDISYEKLTKACLNVRAGATLISTNGDIAIPTERGMVPGNGALTSVVSVSTGVEPIFIGKPEPVIMSQALEAIGMDKEDVLMVGDNYLTDITAGMKAGLDTLMVETGVSTFEGIKGYNHQPTYTYNNLTDVIAALKSE
ncbi:TIGR01457 family HAD-type hydrolase [Halobacillus locisalis]|uniref:Acid sugar phosphatase n=1 Tax=Halobacillus locisalis TaxID=220753 RepID=A0A838CVX2_9BACI|nr:TIGR01457 family HAD-type hydrolase [Halobacillus locisalis]MBA2175756.1 TIGR01457 family HAD-type hydrolase [Halobacillus locisalis]